MEFALDLPLYFVNFIIVPVRRKACFCNVLLFGVLGELFCDPVTMYNIIIRAYNNAYGRVLGYRQFDSASGVTLQYCDAHTHGTVYRSMIRISQRTNVVISALNECDKVRGALDMHALSTQ